MLKFIVLSDIHIVPNGKLSHGLDTAERLAQAVDFINARHQDAQFVIVAGDLADHGETDAYERFKATIAPLQLPVYLTLGNHDDRDSFLMVFAPIEAAETGCIDHVIDAEGHRVIVMDSSDPKLTNGAGRLCAKQLSWLKDQLILAHDRPVVLVLHHNVVPLHVQTDVISLENPHDLAAVLNTHPKVRQIISGHVHMTTSGSFAGIPFCTLGGGHYAIDPELTSRSGPVEKGLVPRREGPGQMAVVLGNDTSVVVHMENYIDRHLVLAPNLFSWD